MAEGERRVLRRERSRALAHHRGPKGTGRPADVMEMVLLIGGQAAGKSTFYLQRFYETHLRINLDMLKTRRREEILVRACFQAQQPFVVDNTNPTRADRQRYIPDAREARFKIVGYHLRTTVEAALARNAARSKPIPAKGVLRTYAKMEPPSYEEGFDELFSVEIDPDRPMGFVVEQILV